MPVNTGSDNEGCFARWGTEGAKYRYTCGDEEARKEAKSKAYQQGLAIGEYAKTLSVGDEVSWKTGGQNPRGRIRDVVKDSKKVPGVDFVIEGTEEDPGYIIEIYEEKDGSWNPTGKFVGRKGDSILANVTLSATKTIYEKLSEFYSIKNR
jgi:Hypervirulence associated proteins TUDOR domain